MILFGNTKQNIVLMALKKEEFLMSIKIGINGFGRIGKLTLQAALNKTPRPSTHIGTHRASAWDSFAAYA